MVEDPIEVDRRSCGDLENGLRLEWLATNGRGGFAGATILQTLTRRYHGLLVAAVEPPVERFVLLAKLDATLSVEGQAFALSTNEYVGAIHPHGYRFLDSFRRCPYPTWRWRAGDVVLEQTLCMADDEDTTFVRYRLLEGCASAVLSVRPLCTSRHFHVLAGSLDIGTPVVCADGEGIAFQWPGGRHGWQLSHNGSFSPRPDWYYQFLLAVEARRGYDNVQDLFTPGTITTTLACDDPVGLVFAASTQGRAWTHWEAAFDLAAARETPRGHCLEDTGGGTVSASSDRVDSPLLDPLLRCAGDFLVSRHGDLKTVIAGYPWFGDWGRDTFISLPGLCLVTGRFADARKIIQAFARHVDRGMIPNRFPDFGDAPAYNTVDATLWYVDALDRYVTYSGDWAFVADEIFPVVADIIEAHCGGTRHGIHMCDDGLLAAGEPGLALTWMDAQLPTGSVTPRIGKPVEINALWYNALRIAAAFAERLGEADRAAKWRALADRASASFGDRFWNPSAGCLYDVVDGPGCTADASIRPNQLLAVSLTHPVLDASRWREVVAVCERELWTPMGLRTLSRGDPGYMGSYAGDLASRDHAYHQGTVWPWLLGPFVTAYIKTFGGSASTRRTAARFLEGLLPHLAEAGIGSVSEVADGDPPHTPGGCPWQAWSVAEPLRALCEDILATHPSHPPQPRATDLHRVATRR